MDAIDAVSLVDAACTQTGLSDFGDDTFRPGLETYVQALNAEAQLNELGSLAVQGAILAALVNRLGVTAWRNDHPDVDDETIDSPVFVIGMFRAGTTLLSNLLDQDRRNRSLLRWESSDTTPPPTEAIARSGPRVEAAQAGVDMLDMLNPAVRAIHHEDADGPTECIAVMAQDFKSLSWEAIANVPSYGRWLRSVDQSSAYRYHRQVLQILQSGGVRGRWTLKSPHHALALDALVSVYPDARLVLLHRDPAVLIASACSLIGTLSATFSDADHRQYIAAHWTDTLAESIDRIEAFRSAHPDHPIIDIRYADLVTDPVETVSSLYADLGSDYDDATQQAVTEYVTTHRGSNGGHRYDPADWGLDTDALHERFAGYLERYVIG